MESIFYGIQLNLANAKILIVDENLPTRRAISSILSRQGFQVFEAESGEEALALALREDPELVLLDVCLQGMDGFETCQRFKETPKINQIPIIFLTSEAEMKSILKGFSAGGSDYITKPFNPIEALARISTHVQVQLLNKSQQKLIDALAKANDARTKMIGVTSHDLRGPLASITEFTRLMMNGTIGNFNDAQKELISTLHQSTDSMLGLVNNLLDVSMIETGEIQLNLEPVNLEELINACIRMSSVQGDKKQIEIGYTNHGLLRALECDPRQIRRLIDNLVGNAIKYSPRNSKTTISTLQQGEHVTICVEDEGPGIPENEMHNLFKEYGTTSVKPTGDEISTGLGLSICKKIVEHHKGTIRAENRESGGMRFRIELPLTQQELSVSVQQSPQSSCPREKLAAAV